MASTLLLSVVPVQMGMAPISVLGDVKVDGGIRGLSAQVTCTATNELDLGLAAGDCPRITELHVKTQSGHVLRNLPGLRGHP